jgi:AcrR family transcriptional regulator
VQNSVLGIEHDVAQRVLSQRIGTYSEEIRRFIDAAYEVMRTTGTIEPPVREIVRRAGLSNAAFYRHFPSKDALLLAVLEDGRRRLMASLERRMAAAAPGADRVRAWIEGVLEQARNAKAADNTRPFAVNGPRLRDRFPVESAESTDRLLDPLRAALRDSGSVNVDRDARAVHDLAFGMMNQLLLERRGPSRPAVEHLVGFALRGITRSDRHGA